MRISDWSSDVCTADLRGVDDVDLNVAIGHRGVLGEDGDALLPLEVHRVHDPLVDVLVGPEGTGLPEHLVDEGGLSMVDVGDERHVAQIRAELHKLPSSKKCGGAAHGARHPDRSEEKTSVLTSL